MEVEIFIMKTNIHMDTLIRSLRECLQRGEKARNKNNIIIGFGLLVIMHTLVLLSFFFFIPIS